MLKVILGLVYGSFGSLKAGLTALSTCLFMFEDLMFMNIVGFLSVVFLCLCAAVVLLPVYLIKEITNK